ncbi:MAG: hypothetical protein HQ559_01435 [Lentisphaerae bacterium]|nr:hypothetical protein [Lentisphaerota bacterium]
MGKRYPIHKRTKQYRAKEYIYYVLACGRASGKRKLKWFSSRQSSEEYHADGR